MEIFSKYIFKSALFSCLAAVLMFSGVLIIGNAARDILDWIASGRLSFIESVKILLIVVPSVISYSLPLGLFAGILITINRLSSSNEWLVMKLTGKNVYKLLLPIFSIAAIATALSCFINLWYAPDSITKYRASFKEILRKNPIRFIQASEFVDWFPGYIIYVDSIEGNKLLSLKIWQLANSASGINCYITAQCGEVSYNSESENIMMKLFNGNAEHFEIKHDATDNQSLSKMMFFNELSVSLPINGILGSDNKPVKKLRHMNIDELLHAREHFQSNQSGILTSAVLKENQILVDTQISNNIAMAFGGLALTFIAIPLGIMKKRSDVSMNIFLALSLAFLYYFVMIALSWLGGNASVHPEVLIWIPNVTLMVIGYYMLRKVSRN